MLHTLHNLAAVHSHLNRLDRAAHLYEECHQARQTHPSLGPAHPDTLLTAGNLAVVYDKLHEPRKALATYLSVLQHKRASLGPADPSTVLYMTLAAIRYANLTEYSQARPLFEEAAAARRAALGEAHPVTLTAVNSLATCLSNLKQHQKALPMYIDVLDRRRAQLGSTPVVAADKEAATALLTTCTNLALCYDTLGDHDRAEPLYVEAWEGRKLVLGEAHQSTLNALQNVAIFYRNQGETDLAEEHYVELLEHRKAVSGVDHDSTLSTMQSLISLYQKAKRPRLAIKAEAIFQAYFDLMVRKYGHQDAKAVQGRVWLEQVQVFF